MTKAISILTGDAYAIKVFVGDGYFEYITEVAINNLLIDSPNIVKAVVCVSKDDVKAPLIISGSRFDTYSYIVVPYH